MSEAGEAGVQVRYIDEVSAENVRAKERISKLKMDIDALEIQSVSKKSLVVTARQDTKAGSPSTLVCSVSSHSSRNRSPLPSLLHPVPILATTQKRMLC